MRALLTHVSVRRSGNVARRNEELEGEAIRIGRGLGNEIALEGLAISLQHAEIVARSDGAYLVPRPPATVLLRGRRIDGDARLAVGDVIRIDRYEMRVTGLAEGGYDVCVELEAVESPASELQQLETTAQMQLESGIWSRRAWSWLAVAGVLFGCLMIPLAFGSQSSWSTGPISNNHASIAGDCSTCHSPFRKVTNDTCMASACHAQIESHVEGRTELAYVDDQRCADCHIEHRGADGLAALDDVTCTSCHADLGERLETRLERASDFGADHPEFTLHMLRSGQPSLANAPSPELVRVRWSAEAQDASGLKFDHREHVGGVKNLEDLSVSNLRCDACHVLDEGGRRMAPIRFEDHCRSCHPLHYGSGSTAMRTAEAPHGEPGELLRQLRRAYLDAELPREQGETEQELEQRRLRYTRPGQKRTPQEEFLVQKVNAKADEAFVNLMSREGPDTCGECHTLLPEESDAPTDIAQVALTRAWFGTSRFDHSSHGAIRCGECHPRAAVHDEQFEAENEDFERAPGTLPDEVPYGLTPVAELQKLGIEPSESATDVLVLGRDNCRTCHAGSRASPPRVASPCVMCHPYHQPGASSILTRSRAGPGT